MKVVDFSRLSLIQWNKKHKGYVMNPIHTGCFIREQRKKLNLSQSKLAEMLGVEPQTVSKWERGLGMPDYENVDRLKEIFGCTLSDILEPSFESPEDEADFEAVEETQETTNLPVLYRIIDDKDDTDESGRKGKRFSIFDFLKKNKMKDILEKAFGYEYANTYNKNFLFKGVFKRRSREECENTITQGMFRNKMSHTVIGIEAPWLYMRVFFFLLICLGISLVGVFISSPIPFIIFGGLVSALPLLVFLFETNFTRNLSIIDVIKMFVIGGLCSILLAMVLFPTANETVTVVLWAPIVEEISKAVLTVFFVSRIKPKNMITGMLIGFSVGAGFSFFENLDYAFYASSEDYISSLITIVYRTVLDFFKGHHYWAGIFGAIYVLFKKDAAFNFKDLFQWRNGLAILFTMSLHAMWNGSSFVGSGFIALLMMVTVGVLSVGALVVLINIGISQARIMGIWEDYRSEHGEEKSTEQTETEEPVNA